MADDGGKPGFLTRLGRAASASARYVISGVDSSSNWFGPMQPLQPMAPANVKGRAFDYRTGYNLQYRPRGTELVGFAKLRALAEGSNIVQTVMNRQKDLIEAFDWSIKPREDQPGRRPAESKFKAAIDGRLGLPALPRPGERLGPVVADPAGGGVRHRRAGDLSAPDARRHEALGAGDHRGRHHDAPARLRRPHAAAAVAGLPADPQGRPGQRLHRRRAVLLPQEPALQPHLRVQPPSADHRHRRGRHRAPALATGLLPGRQLPRQDAQRLRQNGPPSRSRSSRRSGTTSSRAASASAATASGSPGTKVEDLKQPPLKDEFDEWLARKVCFAFSTSPQPFIKQVSRGNQENQQEVAEEGGIATYMQFLKRIMDRIVADDFGQPQLKFVWSEDREFNPTEAATIDNLRLHNGSATLNEVRDRNGDDPYPAEIGDVPLIILATGAISVADALAPPEPPPGDGAATGQGEPPPVAGAAGGATPPKPNAPAKPSEGTRASQLKKDACAALAAAAEAGLVDPLDPAVAAALAEHAAFVKADVEAALDRLAKKASLAVPLETPKMRGQEPRMRAAIGKHLKALGADVHHQAHRKLLAMGKADGDAPTKEDADEIADSLDLSALSAIAEAVEDQLIAVAQDGGGGAIAMLGAADRSALTGQVAVATMNWARARAAERVGKRWTADGQLIDNPSAVWAISQSTRDMLRETIADALAANLDVAGIADAIQNAYAFSAERSALIAHTEIRRANVQGALVGARTARDQDGLAIKKMWLIAGENVCDICLDNAGDGAIGLDEDFSSGDDAPPQHPRCACVLSWQVGAEKSAPRLRSFAEGA